MMIVGVGNRFRGDDAAGLSAAARLRERFPALRVVECDGDVARLLEAWAGEEAVVVIDATASGAAPGTIRRFEAHREPLPAAFARGSTHAFGVAQSVELGRALGRLPARVVVYGIEGARFEPGLELSTEVAAAVESVVEAVAQEAGGRA
jgi:hydrogenase maturation protease